MQYEQNIVLATKQCTMNLKSYRIKSILLRNRKTLFDRQLLWFRPLTYVGDIVKCTRTYTCFIIDLGTYNLRWFYVNLPCPYTRWWTDTWPGWVAHRTPRHTDRTPPSSPGRNSSPSSSSCDTQSQRSPRCSL